MRFRKDDIADRISKFVVRENSLKLLCVLGSRARGGESPSIPRGGGSPPRDNETDFIRSWRLTRSTGYFVVITFLANYPQTRVEKLGHQISRLRDSSKLKFEKWVVNSNNKKYKPFERSLVKKLWVGFCLRITRLLISSAKDSIFRIPNAIVTDRRLRQVRASAGHLWQNFRRLSLFR